MIGNVVKRLFKKFIVGENGAVSIYAIIVVLLVFLFNAVLIDYVRIMVAEYQTDIAVKEAMRSTFSGYDKGVQNSGLFVMNDEDGDPEEVFKEVFEKNLAVDAGDDDYFQFVDTTMENSSFDSDDTRTFANKKIIKHQILEDMKYKAPIAFGDRVLEAFLPAACTMKEAEVVSNAAEDVEENVKDRDELMESAKEEIGNADNKLQAVEKEATDDWTGDDYPSVTNVRDIQANVSDYRESLEDDDPSEEDIEKQDEFHNDSKKVLKVIKDAADDAEADMDDAMSDLEDAKEKNEKIGDAIEEAEEEADKNYEGVDEDQCAEVSAEQGDNDVDDVKEDLEDFYMAPDDEGSDFFQEAIDATNHARDNLKRNNDSLYEYVKKQLDDMNDFYEHVSRVSQIEKKYEEEAKESVDEAGDYVNENYDEVPEDELPADEDDAEDGYRDEAESSLGDIKDLLTAGESILKDQAAYESLSVLTDKYGSADPGDADNLNLDDPEDSKDDSMNMISKLFRMLSDTGIDMRDKLYINEYILTRFTSKEDLKLTDLPDTFLLKNREVEYILYGKHNAAENYGLALTELMGVRFGLNFAAAFFQPGIAQVPFPLLKVAWALSWSIGRTLGDMTKLTEKGSDARVPFMYVKGLKKIETTYKDYLRLFLFLHPDGDDNRITRIQSLIDYSKDRDMSLAYWNMDPPEGNLIESPIYASGKAESSVSLWYLPKIMDMLGKSDVLGGEVIDGRYYIEKQIDYSY